MPTASETKRMSKQLEDWEAGMPVSEFKSKYKLSAHYYKQFSKHAKESGLVRGSWVTNEMTNLMDHVLSKRSHDVKKVVADAPDISAKKPIESRDVSVVIEEIKQARAQIDRLVKEEIPVVDDADDEPVLKPTFTKTTPSRRRPMPSWKKRGKKRADMPTE